jgi:hypothetical protein
MLHCRAMPKILFAMVSFLLVAPIGCDTPERISRLEKQNQELQAELKKQEVSSDYDLQAKCGKDARAWFNANWSRDKDTALLDFTNHYNKADNKCYILVDYHYNSNLAGAGGSSWTNDVELSDIYENVKHGSLGENHYTYFKPSLSASNEVIVCEMRGKKCKTVEEFDNFIRPYMNN